MKSYPRPRCSLVQSLVQSLEPRLLFAYDVSFVDAVVLEPGTYTPGDNIGVRFSFRNDGIDNSPASSFFAYLAKPGFFDDSGNQGSDLSLFGGILFTGTDTTGVTLPSIAGGSTAEFTINLNLSAGTFNGGPFNIFVYAGFADFSFLIADADPGNNFGISSTASISVEGANDPLSNSGGNDPPTVVEPVLGDLDTTFGDNNSGVSSSEVAGSPLQTVATVFDPNTNNQFALAQRDGTLVALRFLPTGKLDPDYATAGLLTLPLGDAPVTAASLVRDPSTGKLVIGATRNDGSAALAVRLNSDGTLDGTFGSGGVATLTTEVALGAGRTALDIKSVALAPDGSVFLAGNVGAPGARDFALLKLDNAGNPAAGFGAAGGVTLDLASGDESARVVLIDAKGRVVLAGSSTTATATRAVAVRFAGATGLRDARFGSRGLLAITAVAGREEQFTAGAIGPKNTLFLAGYSASGDGASTSSVAFAAAFAESGAANSRFGRRGVALLSRIDLALASPNTVIVTPDGGALVAVQIANSLSAAAQNLVGAALWRVDARGINVERFGTNGVRIVFDPGTALDAAPDLQTAFSDFLATRNGAAVSVPGNKVRTLASAPADASTTLNIAQAQADGADLAPGFGGALPSSVTQGQKRAVRYTITNLGSLTADGRARLAISLSPVGGAPVVPSALFSRELRTRVAAGVVSRGSATLPIPTTVSGTYRLVARITPLSGITDISTANNAVSSPTQFSINPRAARGASLLILGPTITIAPPTPKTAPALPPAAATNPAADNTLLRPGHPTDPGSSLFSQTPVL